MKYAIRRLGVPAAMASLLLAVPAHANDPTPWLATQGQSANSHIDKIQKTVPDAKNLNLRSQSGGIRGTEDSVSGLKKSITTPTADIRTVPLYGGTEAASKTTKSSTD